MKTPIKIIASLAGGILWIWILSSIQDYVSMAASQVIGFIVFFACALFITLKPLQEKLESSSYGTIASVVCSVLFSMLCLFVYNRSWYENKYEWICAPGIIILTGACVYFVAGKFDKK